MLRWHFQYCQRDIISSAHRQGKERCEKIPTLFAVGLAGALAWITTMAAIKTTVSRRGPVPIPRSDKNRGF
jgi:hypothetical protein